MAGNASRFQDNRRSSLHRPAFSHVALSAASRLFAAPVDIDRSFNCCCVYDISRNVKVRIRCHLFNAISLASEIYYSATCASRKVKKPMINLPGAIRLV